MELYCNNHVIFAVKDNNCYIKYKKEFEEYTNVERLKLFFTTVKVEKIACGCAHIMVIGSSKCYVWGNNQYGQLGLKCYNDVTIPAMLHIGEESGAVRDISCGLFHSACVIGKGKKTECFVWGSNHHGKLGLNRQPEMKEINELIEPTLINVSESSNVKKLKCGPVSVTWLTEAGTVYTTLRKKFEKIQIDARIDDVECGYYQLLLLSKDGKCYVFKDAEVEDIEIGKDVKKITAGDNHFGYQDGSGQWYLWGSNGYGQLGVTEKYVENPQPLNLENINDVKCSGWNTICVGGKRSVWCSGVIVNNNVFQKWEI